MEVKLYTRTHVELLMLENQKSVDVDSALPQKSKLLQFSACQLLTRETA
jgi:hypothetical protein